MMATMQDFGGLLFGGGGTGLEDYLSAGQQESIKNQAMLQAAAALLSAGGPSRTPISLGQALGGALQAGQQGYGQAQQGAIQNLLTGQKLREGALEQERLKRLYEEWNKQYGGGTPTSAVAGQGGIPAMPMGAGGVPPAGSAPTGQREKSIFDVFNPEQQAIVRMMKPQDALTEALKAASTKYTQMTPEEIQAAGLQEKSVVYKSPSGKPEVIYRPDYQLKTTPSGAEVWVDNNNPYGGPISATKVKSDVGSGKATVSPAVTGGAPTGGAPTYGGGFAPALKPEQIMSAVQDWDTKYRTPVETVLSSYNIVKDLVTTGQAGISDYGVLIKAIKALEPNSAVMQGEAQSAQQMQAIADRMQGFVDKISAGGVGSDQARLDLANLARSGAKIAMEAYNKQADRKSQLLGQYVPKSVINSTFQKYEIPLDISSKVEMEKSLKAGMAANPPAAGTRLTFDPRTNTWSYR
jgi:hypothetical protein